jgi:hypothetical protein
MKNATATSHGKSRLLATDAGGEEVLMRCVPKLAPTHHDGFRGACDWAALLADPLARPILRYHDAPPEAVEPAGLGA